MTPSKSPQSKVSKYLVAAEGEPRAEDDSNQI